jgi:hypothetical protein
MSDYKKLVEKEAKNFYDANRGAFAEEFGGKSASPNLLRWIDRTGGLSERAAAITEKWTLKEFHWVQANTRNRPKRGGGDAAGNAFASFLQDLRHEVKKLSKKSS